MESAKVSKEEKSEITGKEKNKLYPTDIGVVVNDFLVENFPKVLDYSFTANVEKQFDEVASGKMDWDKMLKDFYTPFHENVEHALEHSDRASGERLLGVDPESGKNVYARIGRYGGMVQIGETTDEEKPRFSGLRGELTISTVTLEQALEMFKLPKVIGEYEGDDLTVAIGRFGPYVKNNGKFYSLKDDDPHSLKASRAIEIIEEKKAFDKSRIIKEFPENKDIQVLNGRFGPYISIGKKNVKIPKDREPSELTLQDCLDLAEEAKKNPKKSRRKAKK